MAKKGVNLLDEDGEEKEPGEEGGEEGERPSRRSRGGGGGGLIRTIIIAAAVVAVLGGGGWAGYKFWWLPSKKKEEDRLQAQKRLEELRQQRLAQMRAEAEQRKQALAILEQVQAEQQGKAPGAPPKEGEPKPAAGTPAKPAAPPMAAKEPPKAPAAAKREAAPAAPPAAAPTPAAPPAETPGRPAREVTPPKPEARPAAPRTAQMRPQEGGPPQPPAAPRPPAARRPAPTGSQAYSVQVATCRTDRCVQSFVSRLRAKGLEPLVAGGAAGRSGPVNEVLLGSFASRAEAETLAGQARAKNLRITVYESGGRWRVSAGSFSDLEDAAQALDRAEDVGFRGELARRPGAAAPAGSGLRAVRTGSFATRQEALAARAKVVAAGFPGAFVVAAPRR
ncbi:MAG: SPOR domain-containing protein [Candidatus Tectomicrobia bacterium]|nr:SPOR domain-containing protein [Candidatus Tectomicrobia bacterium]